MKTWVATFREPQACRGTAAVAWTGKSTEPACMLLDPLLDQAPVEAALLGAAAAAEDPE